MLTIEILALVSKSKQGNLEHFLCLLKGFESSFSSTLVFLELLNSLMAHSGGTTSLAAALLDRHAARACSSLPAKPLGLAGSFCFTLSKKICYPRKVIQRVVMTSSMYQKFFEVREKHTRNLLALLKIQARDEGFQITLCTRQKKFQGPYVLETLPDLAAWYLSLEPPA